MKLKIIGNWNVSTNFFISKYLPIGILENFQNTKKKFKKKHFSFQITQYFYNENI